MRHVVITVLSSAALLAQPALAETVHSKITLELQGDGDRNTVTYSCDEDTKTVAVEYINVAPNYLAVMEIEDQTFILTTGVSASGVRYAGGRYVWWTKGAEANLFDQMSDSDAPPIMSCIDASDIP